MAKTFGDLEIEAALKYLGITYSWGGGDKNGPTLGIRDGGVADAHGDYQKVGFDCSGLVLYATYVGSGGKISLEHSADAQSRGGQQVSLATLQPGDVVGFSSNGGAHYHHIGIYYGNGRLLNAPQSGKTVSIMPLSGWASETKAYRRYGTPAAGPLEKSPLPIGKYGRTVTPPGQPGAEKPLPKIGPAAKHKLIPITGDPYYDTRNRLAVVRVAGKGLTQNLTTSVTAAAMSFAADQVGEFSMEFTDTPDAEVLRSGLFAKGTTIDFNDQHLEVRGLDVAPGEGGPRLTVKARSRIVGVFRGKEHTGLGTWGEQDVARWVTDRCAEGGAKPHVQPGLGSMTHLRNDGETTWDSLQAAAKAVGAWCYEVEQKLTFGRPSWIADRVRARWWDLAWHSHTDYSPALTGLPAYSWSADGGGTGDNATESLSFELVSLDADDARPGDGVTLTGSVGAAKGNWIITSVSLPVSEAAAVAVAAVRIVNPKPEPATK